MFKSCGYRCCHRFVRAAKVMHIQSVAAWSKKLKLTFRETITMCPHNKTIGGDISRWNRYLARDPPSYDSGMPLPEAVAKIMMDKIEVRSKTMMDVIGAKRAPLGTGLYEKGTIAGDDPKVFRDKYRFLPHRETEINLRNIWAAMQRAVSKTRPSSHDYSKLKAVFQQYKDCLLYTSPSPRDRTRSRMPSSA